MDVLRDNEGKSQQGENIPIIMDPGALGEDIHKQI